MIEQIARPLKPAIEPSAPAEAPLAVPPPAANANAPAHDAADDAARLAAAALARERLRHERQRHRARQRRLWLSLAAFLAALATLLTWRAHDVVHYLPGAAHAYRALGMEVSLNPFRVRDMRLRWLSGPNGTPELAVSGRIANTAPLARPAPRATFILRDFSGRPLRRWHIPVRGENLIPAGGVARFHTRIANPPAQASSLDIVLTPAPSS